MPIERRMEVAIRVDMLTSAADEAWDRGDRGLAAALFQAAMLGEIRNSLATIAKQVIKLTGPAGPWDGKGVRDAGHRRT